MKVFKICGYSKCGSYFASYLRSVTVCAENEDQARQSVAAWLKDSGNSFLRDDLSVECLGEIEAGRVIDYNEDSDY